MSTPVTEKPSILVHSEKSMEKTLFDIKWVPCSARFVVLGNYPRQTGSIQVCELDSSGGISVLSEEEKKESFKCGTFGASSLKKRNFATGDFDGNLRIWDLEKLSGLPLFSTKAHSEIINDIDGVGGLGIGEGPKEIVTGSRDGSVKVWDPRQQDPVACMKPKEGETKRDCWTVAFGHAHNDVDRCVAAGYDNGDIKLFDLKNMSLRWETNVKNGVCCVEFDRKDINMNKLVATVLESKVHIFDLRTQHPNKGFAKLSEKAHESTVWAARHLPQNRDILMTLGGNGSAYLWKYHYPSSRVEKDKDDIDMGVVGSLNLLENTTLTKQPINAFDWSPDKEGLAVCTAFDQCVRVLIVTKLART